MGMTIAVYRVNADTGARTCVRRTRTVRPAKAPEVVHKYPPCACPRCTAAPQTDTQRKITQD